MIYIAQISLKLECGRMPNVMADAQRDGSPAEYRWSPLLIGAVWLTPTTRMPCSNAANIGQRKI